MSSGRGKWPLVCDWHESSALIADLHCVCARVNVLCSSERSMQLAQKAQERERFQSSPSILFLAAINGLDWRRQKMEGS